MTIRYSLAVTALMARSALAQHVPVTAFDVAGVHLGDTPSSAANELHTAGYKIDTSTTPSFEQAVAREAARRRGAPVPGGQDLGVVKLIGTGPRLEHVEVTFEQTAAGSRVSEITVLVPATSVTATAIKAQLTGKYGPPDAVRGQGSELSWCSPQVIRTCGASFVSAGPLPNEYPALQATARDGAFIALRQGRIAERRAADDREAAIERLAPKGKAAF